MICEKNECTGCFACYNKCMKKAINMKEDVYGNIYPEIDQNICIECGSCKKSCPQLEKYYKFKYPNEVFCMYAKKNEIRCKSTSGGIATLIGKKIIENGGVVYGASNLFNCSNFKFTRIDKIEELYKIQGSKYVHCWIEDAYEKAKNDLINGRKVLFTGTPCQIAGLKSFLKMDYDNLITVDIICHGVASQKLLFEDLKQYNINRKDYSIITFRDEKGYNLKLYKNSNDYKNGKYFFSKLANRDFYYKNFLRGNIFRENCYDCKYARKERISDITLGDFWGLNNKSKLFENKEKGISAVIIMTLKGKNIINSIKDECIFEKRLYDEVFKSNKQLNAPMCKNKRNEKYNELYPKYDYRITMKKINKWQDYLKYNFLYDLLKNR